MSSLDASAINAVSIAGSTFAIGLVVGWALALFLIGGSSGSSNNADEDQG